jgi:hypothetical protein
MLPRFGESGNDCRTSRRSSLFGLAAPPPRPSPTRVLCRRALNVFHVQNRILQLYGMQCCDSDH